MTREQEIKSLQARYLIAVDQRKRKMASLIFARLAALMARQLRAEVRQEKRKAA